MKRMAMLVAAMTLSYAMAEQVEISLPDTATVRLDWQAIPGQTYRVLTTTNLVDQPWQEAVPGGLVRTAMPFDQPIPRTFTAPSIREHAPPLPGVYGISNAREWIYIGGTGNIQAALLLHLQESNSPVLQRHPAGFVFEVCGEAAWPARQDRLVLEYEPACNRSRPRHA